MILTNNSNRIRQYNEKSLKCPTHCKWRTAYLKMESLDFINLKKISGNIAKCYGEPNIIPLQPILFMIANDTFVMDTMLTKKNF